MVTAILSFIMPRPRNGVEQIVFNAYKDGEWVAEDELREYIVGQYNELFASQGVARSNEVIDKVIPRVTEAMNASLNSAYDEEEVKQALEGIGDLKAPGPDGMPAIFFKKFWEVVGPKVKTEALAVLNDAEIPEGWNDTSVALIPKVKNPEKLKEL